jgi:hypothetical protein
MEDTNVPLTRSKGDKTIQQKPEPVPETIPVVPPTKPVKEKKPRAPKTPAQLEAFQKAMQKRKANIEIKKQEKKVEASKILLENDIKPKEVVKKSRKPRTVVIEESESDDEPNVVYIKKRSSKKKKKKIIVESETDSETESESDIEIKHKKSFETSHQNKKSVKGITVVEPIKKSYHNFFAD